MTRWLAPADGLLEVDRVYARLRSDLMDGSARPGTELTPAGLIQRYQAAGETADVAVARLVAEGLLLRRGNSVVIPALDRAEVMRILHMRRQLEPDMCAEACRHVPRSELTALIRTAHTLAAEPTPAAIAQTVEHAHLLVSGANVLTDWSAKAIRMAWPSMRRYVQIAARALMHTGHLAQARDLGVYVLAEYRTRGPRRVRAARLRGLDDLEYMLDLGLRDEFSRRLSCA